MVVSAAPASAQEALPLVVAPAPQVTTLVSGTLEIILSILGGLNYLEVSRREIDLGGDFDGSVTLGSGGRTYHVPALGSDHAIEWGLGYLGDGGAFTATYLRASLPASTALGDTSARFRQYGGDLVFYPWMSGEIALTPVLRFGATYTTLDVPESILYQSVALGAGYDAWAYHLGGGLTLRMGAIDLTADYSRRFLGFDDIDGATQRVSVDGGLSAKTDVLTLRAGIYLGWRG